MVEGQVMNKRRQGRIKFQAVALGAVVLSALSISPAQADFWGYSPYTGSSNWFWLNRSLLSPIGLFGGGTGYSAPAYLAGTAAWTAGTALSRGVLGRQYQGDYRAYRQQSNGSISNGGGSGAVQPASNGRAAGGNGGGPNVVDQISYLRPSGLAQPAANEMFGTPDPAKLNNLSDSATLLNPLMTAPPVALHPGALPVPATAPSFNAARNAAASAASNAAGNATGSAASNAAGNVAESVEAENKRATGIADATGSVGFVNSAPDFRGAANAPEAGNALQSLFLKHLLIGYQGDIVKAMQDKEMSRLAAENGLNIENMPSKLSNSEKAMIRKILSDEKETPQARLVALRFVLKQ